MPKTRLKQIENSPNDVRPIGARALKSVIDTLRPYLQDAKVLDLFAGQGRFGITASDESISSVLFIENDPKASATIKSFVVGRQFPKQVTSNVFCRDVFLFLDRCKETFDIVFADPPFPLWNDKFATQLFSGVYRVLQEGSIFLVKQPSRMVPCSEIEGLTLFKTSDFGESRLLYFRYEKK